MKILYVTQFFPPESIAAAFRAYENVMLWQSDGEQPTVFTTYPNYPTGRIFSGYKNKLLNLETINGIHVVRSKIIVKKKASFFNRILNMSSFFTFGLFNFLFNGRKIGKDFDVILGTSGTVFAALLAWLFAVIHRIPFVFEIRDIVYRQLIATGKNISNITVRMMKKLELFLCKRACRIVSVTNDFKNVLVSDGIDADKINVITNGFQVGPLRKQPQNIDKFILSYFGTLGISQKVEETLVYAAKLNECCDGFLYKIIGEGAQREVLERELATGQYPYVQLFHGMSQEKLEVYYEEAEMSVVSLVQNDNFSFTIPSKLFQIMGRGIAVLYIGPDGEAAKIIRKYNAGLALCGTKKENLYILATFFDQPDYHKKLRQMGENGYKAVCKNYDRKVLAKSYLDILRSCKK